MLCRLALTLAVTAIGFSAAGCTSSKTKLVVSKPVVAKQLVSAFGCPAPKASAAVNEQGSAPIGELPEWAGGGRLIAFWGVDSLYEQVVMRTDGSERRILDTGIEYPSVSPSGTMVAEVPEDPSGHTRGILTFKMLGQRCSRTFRFPVRHYDELNGYPAWAPDERAVAIETSEGDVFVADTRSGVRLVARESWYPLWSPDGQRLAVQGDCRTVALIIHCMLVVLRSDGKRRTAVAEVGGGFTWSPDGRWLAFANGIGSGSPLPKRWRKKRDGIYVVRPDGSRFRRVTVVPVTLDDYWQPGPPVWSPDGRTLAFEDRTGIVVVSVRDGRTQRVTLKHSDHHWISWAPGERILYSRRNSIFTVVPGKRPEPIRGVNPN
jgi:Tol biopolymer transport system component